MGEECEDEGAAELLTVIPIAHSWCITARKKVENSGMKKIQEEGRVGGEGILKFVFVSHNTTLVIN